MKDINYLKEKRTKVLNKITPICEAFGITDYDYIVNEIFPTETLKIYDTLINCACNSISAVVDELIGWIFVNRYCQRRNIGAFEKQTLNVIKQYWRNK